MPCQIRRPNAAMRSRRSISGRIPSTLLTPMSMLNFSCGNVGVQMDGWCRKEINSVGDIKGLRMRTGELGGIAVAAHRGHADADRARGHL